MTGAVLMILVLLSCLGFRRYREKIAVETQQEAQLCLADTGEERVAAGAAAVEETAGLSEALSPSENLYRMGQEQKKKLATLEDSTWEYQGKRYRRNSYTKAILCMGVDRNDEMTGTREYGQAGQSDGIFLIAHDTARNRIQILMIPRDTMAEMDYRDGDGKPLGRRVSHVTLPFAFHDGSYESCEAMAEVISDLLCGLSIDHYFAADTAVIATLNDAVGGVTVTIPNDGMEQRDPAFVKGSQVTLKGSQAEAFVRFRDIDLDNSALYRMDQHEEYIRQFLRAVEKKSQEDSQIVPHLFDLIQAYMITDMEKAEYLKVGVDVLAGEELQHEDFRTLPGMGIATETYDEYYVNYDQAIPMILELFYHELVS